MIRERFSESWSLLVLRLCVIWLFSVLMMLNWFDVKIFFQDYDVQIGFCIIMMNFDDDTRQWTGYRLTSFCYVQVFVQGCVMEDRSWKIRKNFQILSRFLENLAKFVLFVLTKIDVIFVWWNEDDLRLITSWTDIHIYTFDPWFNLPI